MASHKILVADDDEDILRIISIILRQAGYSIILAKDAYQALEMAISQKPDLILMDIHMPVGDGFSVQERMNRLSADLSLTPIIYVTGDTTDQALANAHKHGAVALLQKPFEPAKLIDTVRAALGKYPAVA
jgi:two-component system response regulator GlrR